jgi:hypothetical protein
MVDFQKGEKCVLDFAMHVNETTHISAIRQMNMDYAICQAAKYRTGKWLSLVTHPPDL